MSGTRKKQLPGKKHAQRLDKERVKKVIIALLILFIVVSIITEFVPIVNFKSVLYWLFGAISIIILNIITSNKESAKKNENAYEGWLKIFHKIVHEILDRIILLFLVSIGVVMFLGIKAGNYKIYARTYYAVDDAIKAFVEYDPIEVKKNRDIEKKKTTYQNTEAVQSVLNNQRDEKKNLIERVTIQKVELEERNKLSENDRNELFYLSGKYRILNWNNQDEINKKVLLKVHDEIGKQEENVFDKKPKDGGAPQKLCDKISEISEKENSIKTFTEKKENLEERECAYSIYPKESLANLLANDYQDIALILYYNNGDSDSILYHYAQSIQYRHQVLGFAGLFNTGIKRKINFIEKSYKDLEIMYAQDTEINLYSKKLKKAYQFVADQY
ncbi:MAG: hypothetical protein J1F02_02620 [Lachnospiraceae bacterium]|nr:hypothetical protein [Lachnospiraceae bacterium]